MIHCFFSLYPFAKRESEVLVTQLCQTLCNATDCSEEGKDHRGSRDLHNENDDHDQETLEDTERGARWRLGACWKSFHPHPEASL